LPDEDAHTLGLGFVSNLDHVSSQRAPGLIKDLPECGFLMGLTSSKGRPVSGLPANRRMSPLTSTPQHKISQESQAKERGSSPDIHFLSSLRQYLEAGIT
jgi:hypothetical protein